MYVRTDLRRAVPQRDDLVREGAHRQAERASQTEVGELEGEKHKQIECW
jgi:hypothetical protein